MTVYLVSGTRRTLHKAVQSDTGTLVDERCNTDQATHKEVYTDWNAAKSAAKRWCSRCFASGPA